MANAVRVKVELRKKFNEPMRNYKEMLQEFCRRVTAMGIRHDFRECQRYESESVKRRKQKREAHKKMQLESMKGRLLAGERVNSPAGLVKKARAELNKDKNDKKRDRWQRKYAYEA